MPMMVMHNKNPKKICDTAAHKPPVKIQIILPIICKQPPLLFAYTTLLPNGHKINVANLKHCKPNGIPMIVKHKINPPHKYAKAEINPPKTNQIILPIKFILLFVLNKDMLYKCATQLQHH